MKFSQIVLIVVLSFAVAFATVKYFAPSNTGTAAPITKESAYDRVLRTGTLRCGYLPWPPYFSMDANTKILSGVSKELSDKAVEILGLKISYVDVALGQQEQDLKNGKIDAMCGDGPFVFTSIKYLDYSTPFFYVPEMAYGRSDETRFVAVGELNKPDVTFVAIDGDLSTQLAMNYFPDAKIDSLGSLTDPSQMLLDVVTKKADVVIDDPVSVDLFAKNNVGKIKALFATPLAVYGGGFSVKKGETNLLNMLNGAIAASANTGQTDRILKRYDPTGKLLLEAAIPYK